MPSKNPARYVALDTIHLVTYRMPLSVNALGYNTRTDFGSKSFGICLQ